jgi:hypothetical protein
VTPTAARDAASLLEELLDVRDPPFGAAIGSVPIKELGLQIWLIRAGDV